MRVVMMGTGPFAVPSFHWLLNSEHDVLALVTRPPKTTRRRSKPAPNPMRDAANIARITIHCPLSINSPEALRILNMLKPELLVVCDYGQILSKSTLATASRGGINLHASILPAYRGAAPINWALFDGCEKTGVSVIHMTPQLDGGPILAVKPTLIRDNEDAVQLEVRLAELGVSAVAESLRALAGWDNHSPIGSLQNQERATRAPRLQKNNGIIDWTRSAVQLANQVRAFQPWPSSFTFWERERGQLLRLVVEKTSVDQSDVTVGKPPGSILTANGNNLIVVTGNGLLKIKQIRPAGKRLMTAAEFLRGNSLRPGDILCCETNEHQS